MWTRVWFFFVTVFFVAMNALLGGMFLLLLIEAILARRFSHAHRVSPGSPGGGLRATMHERPTSESSIRGLGGAA